jgi:hypothetical protein
MVKNGMFCLAKQNVLDPTQSFYLFQVGDDPQERLFGKLRMLGRHNTAMNYSQAIDRLGHTSDLQGAFMRNPDQDQGERRLNMSRSEGVDHLTMKAFTGNLIASSCHQPSAWADGRENAIALLKKWAIAPQEYDYQSIFADGKTDMLAPFGSGLYPGVDLEGDQTVPQRLFLLLPPTRMQPTHQKGTMKTTRVMVSHSRRRLTQRRFPSSSIYPGPESPQLTTSPSTVNGLTNNGSAG